MTYTPLPDGTLLDLCEYFGIRGHRKVYRNDGRFFTWDSQHAEVEVFDKNGFHLGTIDAHAGTFVKAPVKGRRINV